MHERRRVAADGGGDATNFARLAYSMMLFVAMVVSEGFGELHDDNRCTMHAYYGKTAEFLKWSLLAGDGCTFAVEESKEPFTYCETHTTKQG